MLKINSAAFILVILCVLQEIVQCVKLPPEIGRCRADDPKLSDCLKKNVEGAIRFFKHGAPQLGIPPFEPLKIKELVIGQSDGPVNVKQEYKNIDLFGLTDSIITKYRANLAEDKLFVESTSPNLNLIGDYIANGRVLVLPLRGEGKCNITLTNSKIIHELSMEKYKRKGKTYWKMIDYIVSIQPERMYYFLDNLFDGDQRLGTEINNVLNENWESIYNDVRTGYERSFGLIFKNLADSLFSRVPYDQIFILKGK